MGARFGFIVRVRILNRRVIGVGINISSRVVRTMASIRVEIKREVVRVSSKLGTGRSVP